VPRERTENISLPQPARDADGQGSLRAMLRRLVERAHAASEPVERLLRDPLAPVIALCIILVLSLGARLVDLKQPCSSPCKTPGSHTLIFDEDYYVNAARVIDHINPPEGSPYHNAPFGDDPNAEHPQLAKLVIAAGIKVFGDGPFGWRIGSILFSLIALAALYALVLAAGGTRWVAVGAVAIAAVDNLMLVQGRIATLDIYAVAMMIIAATLYLRRRPILAGVALGIGACMKEVALYLLLALIILEALRVLRAWWTTEGREGMVKEYVRPLGIMVGVSLVSSLLILWLLDVLVPAYDPGTHAIYGGSPFTHFFHMYHFALLLKLEAGKPGISSTPWEWLLNEKAIPYAKTAVNSVANGQIVASHNIYFFQGEINPFIIFLVVPAACACVAIWWRGADTLALVGVAWCAGTFLPSAAEYVISNRVDYLYYMLVVMPGIYLVLVRVFADRRMPRSAVFGWAVMLLYGFADLFPIRTLL
jgi:predicted membrane-bound dolichyl-phosphate-mannose-protein mannosyltransferase